MPAGAGRRGLWADPPPTPAPSHTDPDSGSVAAHRQGGEREEEVKRSVDCVPSLFEVCLGLSSTYTSMATQALNNESSCLVLALKGLAI